MYWVCRKNQNNDVRVNQNDRCTDDEKKNILQDKTEDKMKT